MLSASPVDRFVVTDTNPPFRVADAALRADQVSQVLVVPRDYLETGTLRRYARTSNLFSGAEDRTLARWIVRALLAERADSTRIERVARPLLASSLYVLGREGRYEIKDDRRELLELMLPLAFGMMLGLCIVIGGQYLLQGVSEEKESRILESLLCRVSAEELMAGKLFGLGAAGLLVVVIWTAAAMGAFGPVLLLAGVKLPPGLLLTALGYFLLGYLFYGSIMTGIGAVTNGSGLSGFPLPKPGAVQAFPEFVRRERVELRQGVRDFEPRRPVGHEYVHDRAHARIAIKRACGDVHLAAVLEHRDAAPGLDRGDAAAHDLEHLGQPADLLQEIADLETGAGHLHRARGVALVEQLAAIAADQVDHGARRAGGDVDLDQQQLHLDVLAAGQVGHLDHVDELARLLDDLVDHGVGAAGHDRQARHGRIVRRRDRQRVDVVAARGEHPGQARQRAGFVLQQHRDDVSHGAPTLPVFVLQRNRDRGTLCPPSRLRCSTVRHPP